MVEWAWHRVAPLLLVLAGGLLIAVLDTLSVGLVAALALMLLIATRPAIGAYLYLFVTPLVAGIDRDIALPPLRIHEALLALILCSLALRGLVRMAMGHRYVVRLTVIDRAAVILAIAASFVSLLWRFSQGEPISTDDLFYAAVLWKYLALYAMFRVAVQTREEAGMALGVALFTTAIVSILAIFQALGLFGVPELLFRYYPPFLGDTVDVGRGASTLALTFAVADICLICLAATIVLFRRTPGRGRVALGGLALLYFLGTVAAGQFSGFIGIGVAAVALGYALGEIRTVMKFGIPAALLGTIGLWPVIGRRLAGFSSASGLPQSWSGRLQNLTDFILPEFANGWNILFGVRPAARVPAPEVWRDWVFIESGYVWLLWTGGIPLLLAFVHFVRVCLRRARAVMSSTSTPVVAIGTGVFVGLWVIVVLTILDPHLTMRGVGDLVFPMLAMIQIGGAMATRPGVVGSPPRTKEVKS